MARFKPLDALVALTLVWLFTPQTAFAYLDPGAGSFVVQVAVGSLLGAMFFFKNFFGQLKFKIQKFFSSKQKEV
ncbi:MAG: hypothetical protein IPK79_09470 [Vampirovibrionales bacterium]|nr:hypothetical protein [Vampirovibrionales bacterium]